MQRNTGFFYKMAYSSQVLKFGRNVESRHIQHWVEEGWVYRSAVFSILGVGCSDYGGEEAVIIHERTLQDG
jgi:hypothetical protein